MQLLKQIPKDILSSTTFPLILSITCSLTETIIGFFNPNVSTPYWQINNQSLKPHDSLFITLLKNLRGHMMHSYHSYFDFMRMILILHIIIQLSQKYLAQKSSVTFPEAQQDQESIQKEDTSLPMATNSKRYLFKAFQCLFYFMAMYYLCQLANFVGAKDILEPLDMDPEQLPMITKTRGAITGVTSSDGRKVFQIYKMGADWNSQCVLTGMDISDPLAIKYYPQSNFKLKRDDITLVLSLDSETLFLVTWDHFYIYSISHIRSPPKFVSKTPIPESDASYMKPSAALYEGQDVIIIGTNYLHIFNISDINNPVHLSQYPLPEKVNSIAILYYQKTALVGAQDGLRAFDLSDLNKPIMKTRILDNEFVFSISVSSLESTAFIGILNKNITEAQLSQGIETWDASLSIYLVDLKKPSLPYRSFFTIDQLKTCRANIYLENFGLLPDFKMTSDNKYAYWACNKDYGSVDIAQKKVSRFLSEKTINAIALAQGSKILLKMGSDKTSLYALYQNIERNDPFIWKPVSISRLKLSPESQVFTSKNNRIVFVINESTLQIFNTPKNSFSEISTIELQTKPLSFVPSKDGKRFYMKTDEKTIQIYDGISTQKLASIDFMTTIDDNFVVASDDKLIFATQKIDQNTAIIFANISNPSSPSIEGLLIEGKKRDFTGSVKLMISPDGNQLVILGNELIILDVTTALTNRSAQMRFLVSGRNFDSVAFSPTGYHIFMVESDKDLNQKKFTSTSGLSFPLPHLAGNLPLEVSISNEGDFLFYVSTPEHLMEIKIPRNDPLTISRLMKLSLKQFSLTGDGKFMYAVVEDSLEILDLRSKYALASFKEDFPLGASNKVELQLLSRNSLNKYDAIFKNHKFLAANFYKTSNSTGGNELVISYSGLPNWINFDKETAEITIESRLPTHLGTYKMFTTGSFQLPPPSRLSSSLPFLDDLKGSNQLISDLAEKGYIDEEGFLTTKFSPYKKLTLNPQYSQFESDIRYFLRNYITDQEFAFKVSPSLFLHHSPSLIEIETQSPHYTTARIVAPETSVAQFVQRTYSSSRSFLNENQTELTLEGTFLSINDAFKEVIIDIKEPYEDEFVSIIINDNLNPPISTLISVSRSPFRINAKPIANSDQNLSVQSQLNKYSFISGQSFSINLHPKTYLDVNERPLEYSSSSPELDWLEIRGLTLTGTPPKKLWPSKVNVTMNIANEFKSEKVTFTLEIGMSAVILMQYVILYFGYLFSAYKMYQNHPKFYNILAQKFYRYPKMYQISVNQEATDATIAPIGFFGKEFENADLLMNHLKKYITKSPKDFIDYFKDDQGRELNKTKLITTINQALEGLNFEERYSVKYYIQIDDDQKDIIHQIMLDKILLLEISLSSERQTLKIFKKIKDQWIDIVEQEDPSQPYFKVNKLKLNYVLQNIDSKKKQLKSSESTNSQKDGFLDMTQSSDRSRYFSNSHLFEKSANNIAEILLDSTLNDKLENVNMGLLELALKAHAFKSHHLNAHREQITIVSKERKVGFSCFYKIKALLRYHLQDLQFANKEDLGYGLKYVFKKDIMYFCGTPEARMEYETLVVQFLDVKGMIMREIYIFGAENKNRKREKIEQVQEQL